MVGTHSSVVEHCVYTQQGWVRFPLEPLFIRIKNLKCLAFVERVITESVWVVIGCTARPGGILHCEVI